MNLWRNFDGRDTTTFALSDVIDTQRGATAVEIGGGLSARLSQQLAVFAAAGYTAGLDGNHRETVQGQVGVRIAW